MPEHCFCCFLKNKVPCEFPLLKLYNFCIFYLIDFQVMTRTIFIKSYPVPNYEGGRPTILKRQISQKIFTSEFMLPDSQKIFDALPGSYPSPATLWVGEIGTFPFNLSSFSVIFLDIFNFPPIPLAWPFTHLGRPWPHVGPTCASLSKAQLQINVTNLSQMQKKNSGGVEIHLKQIWSHQKRPDTFLYLTKWTHFHFPIL